MNRDFKFIGSFLGMPLYVETKDERRAEFASKTLTALILREDTDVDKEIAKMKLDANDTTEKSDS